MNKKEKNPLTILQRFKVFSMRLCYPKYFYGYFVAAKALREADPNTDDDILMQAYNNALCKRYALSILNILPRHDKIDFKDFGNNILEQYDKLVLKQKYWQAVGKDK